MEIVVNEWLLDFLRPESKDSDKVKALKFVNAWVEMWRLFNISGFSYFQPRKHEIMFFRVLRVLCGKKERGNKTNMSYQLSWRPEEIKNSRNV